MNIFSKILNSLRKTRENFGDLISKIFHGELNDEFFEDLEYALISSDMGVGATQEILEQLKQEAKQNKIKTKKDFEILLKKHLINLLQQVQSQKPFTKPVLMTFVGVNGVGKTTAIGRLAHYFKGLGDHVLVVAADTFRAAATEQLTQWAERTQVRIVKYDQGADASAVVYDGIASALAKHDDVVLVDTAGRLHTKTNLMEELKKMYRIIENKWGEHQFLNYLVLDATTGQNALQQVKMFQQSHAIDGIVLTKLDGTAKGGMVFAIAKEYGIPVVFVGVGESAEDMVPFDPETFVDGLL